MMQTVLAVTVTIYGVAGALASILQLRRMRKRGSSDDVSLGYLSIVGGGYVLWLAYGIAIEDLPLVLVDALGGAAILATISVAVKLRGLDPMRRPSRGLPGSHAGLRRSADSSPPSVPGGHASELGSAPGAGLPGAKRVFRAGALTRG